MHRRALDQLSYRVQRDKEFLSDLFKGSLDTGEGGGHDLPAGLHGQRLQRTRDTLGDIVLEAGRAHYLVHALTNHLKACDVLRRQKPGPGGMYLKQRDIFEILLHKYSR